MKMGKTEQPKPCPTLSLTSPPRARMASHNPSPGGSLQGRGDTWLDP